LLCFFVGCARTEGFYKLSTEDKVGKVHQAAFVSASPDPSKPQVCHLLISGISQ